MKAKAAHAKGKRMEKIVLDYIRENLDAHAYTPRGSGNGLEKGDVYLPNHNVVIEVKNQKKVMLGDWWEQAEEQAHNQTPALIIRHPNFGEGKKTLAVIYFEDYVDLLQKQSETVEVVETEADYTTREAVLKMETAVKTLKKKYGL